MHHTDSQSRLRHQYEQLPYPPRDPQDEWKRLLAITMDTLATINFHCFGGRQSFDGCRILVAGGGTGDSTIFLAEQLHGKDAEVVYLDVSRPSMDVAKARAELRKLKNIRFVHGSINELPKLDAGRFDYISCTGVLHHLRDPLKGLINLENVLQDDGAMGLMLYGKYGRTAIYQLQNLLRLINQDVQELETQLENTKRLLKTLPDTNWFKRAEEFHKDHKCLGDAGIADLLLNPQDRAYSIPELYGLLDSAQLTLVEFCIPQMRLCYRPEQFIYDAKLLQALRPRSIRERQAIAELLVGAFKTHEIYVAKHSVPAAGVDDLDMIPFFYPEREQHGFGPNLAATIRRQRGQTLQLQHGSGFSFSFDPGQYSDLVFEQIDGKRSLTEIFAAIRQQPAHSQLDNGLLLADFRPVFERFRQLDWLLLKHPCVGTYPDVIDMQTRFHARTGPG